MSNERGRPVGDGAARRSGGPAQSIPRALESGWADALSTPDLKKAISTLDAAIAATNALPGSLADYDDLVSAAAVARMTLKRRQARERIAEARKLLNELGWSA